MKSPNSMLIFYDGNCPICCAKKDFLQRRDQRNRLAFCDIRAPDFQRPEQMPPIDSLASEIHSLQPDGQILRGMAVIRAAYRVIGLGWLAAPTGWPLLRPLFDLLYAHIAANRQFYSEGLRIRRR